MALSRKLSPDFSFFGEAGAGPASLPHASAPRPRDARGAPFHGWDVAPHVHGVLDGSATDVLDGHGVGLREGDGPWLRVAWAMTSPLTAPGGLSPLSRRTVSLSLPLLTSHI